MPFRIDEAMLAQDEATAADCQATACISCGCCSYVCPAKRRLSVRTTAARNALKGGKR
jgi:electron transport complex protein RnfC